MLAKSASLKVTLQSLAAAVLVALVGMLTAGCPGKGAAGVSGTYEAKTPEGSMTLEFKGDNKVRLGMLETGQPAEYKDGDYMTNAEKITVQVPGGFPMELVNKGDTLETSAMGQILIFRKK